MLTLDELVRRYGDVVYNLALRLTCNAADAEDLAQEALIKAVRGLSAFRGDSEPATWLYRIVVNTWKNSLRWRASRFVRRFFSEEGEVLSEPEDAASEVPGPEAAAEAAELSRAIELAMARLDPEERAVLVLRELDGQSYDEIARALGIPLGTVKSRLARARSILAEHLSKEQEPDDARDR